MFESLDTYCNRKLRTEAGKLAKDAISVIEKSRMEYEFTGRYELGFFATYMDRKMEENYTDLLSLAKYYQ